MCQQKVHRWKCFLKNVKTGEKNVHGGNIFYPFCDTGGNFTPWGWGTQNLCTKTGTDSGAGSCVNFRKSLLIFAKVEYIIKNILWNNHRMFFFMKIF